MRWRFESVVEHQLARLAQRKSACATCRMSTVRSGQRAPIRVRSSSGERRCDAAEAAGAEPAGRTIFAHHLFPSRSSVAEQSLDKRSTDVRFITGGPSPRQWIWSVKPEWRWSDFLTRAHVVRNHPDPPSWTCAPSGQGSGFLIRCESIVGSSPTRSSNSIRARAERTRS